MLTRLLPEFQMTRHLVAPEMGGPERAEMLNGLNYDHLVYIPGKNIESLDLETYQHRAWPVLHGIEPSREKSSTQIIPLVSLSGGDAAILGGRLAAQGLSSIPVPKSLYDLLYLHGLSTCLHRACAQPLGLPDQELIARQDYSNYLDSGEPKQVGTREKLPQQRWQALASQGLSTAVPLLEIMAWDGLPGTRDSELTERINDPRTSAAGWSLNQHAMHLFAEFLGENNRAPTKADLQLFGRFVIDQLHKLHKELEDMPWGNHAVSRMGTAYGYFFAASFDHRPASKSLLRDDLVMAAIEHEISTPSHIYTLYRTGDLSLDLHSPTFKDHLLSFSNSALTGALFDARGGCCTSESLSRAENSKFYAFDLPFDQGHLNGFYIRNYVYLPPLRMSSRIAEAGEFLHARLRATRQHGAERTLTGFNNIYWDLDAKWKNEFTYQPRPDRDTALEFLEDHTRVLNKSTWASYLRWPIDASASLCAIQ